MGKDCPLGSIGDTLSPYRLRLPNAVRVELDGGGCITRCADDMPPCFGDQFGIARYVCDVWRVGAEVDVESQLERGKIREAIERLMDEKEGKEVRERTRDLKEMADKCVVEGGSSHMALQNLLDFVMSL